MFRATVKHASFVKGRGTVIGVEPFADAGLIRVGDRVAVPLKVGGTRVVEVRSLDFPDFKIAGPKPQSEVELNVGKQLTADDVAIGSELVSPTR